MAANDKDAINAQIKKDFFARYEIGREPFGKGGFGSVFIAEDKESHERIAAKKIKKLMLHQNRSNNEAAKLKRKKEQTIENEIKILKMLDHPNIIKFIGLVEDDFDFIICMELCEGRDLFDKIITDKIRYTENDAKEVVKAIVSALQHCHNHGIVHRDLKPENIMLRFSDPDQLTNIRLIDFGLACKESEIVDGLPPCGTKFYMAPEIYTYRKYTRAVDMWSLGVFVMVLFYGRYPAYHDNAQLMSGNYEFPAVDVTVSDDAKDFIMGLMCRDVQQRLTADTALMHRWLVEPSDESNGAYEFDSRPLFLFKARRKALIVLRAIIYMHSLMREKKRKDSRATVPAELCVDVNVTPSQMMAAWHSVGSVVDDGAGVEQSPVHRLSSFAQQVSSGSNSFPDLPRTYSNRAEMTRRFSSAGMAHPNSNNVGMARFSSLPPSISNPLVRSSLPPPAPQHNSSRAGSGGASAGAGIAKPAAAGPSPMLRQFSAGSDRTASEAHRLLNQLESPQYPLQNSSSAVVSSVSSGQDERVRLLALQREHLSKEVAKSEQILRAVEAGLLDGEAARLQIEALSAAISLTSQLSNAVSNNHR